MSTSVVIVNCDQDHYLAELLDSIEGHPCEDIIIVDALQHRRSLARSLRYGTHAVRTEFFIPIAADDVFLPGFVEKTTAAIGSADACYTFIQCFGLWSHVIETGPWPNDLLEDHNTLPGGALYRTTSYWRVGGYDVRDEWWVDWGLWLKLKHAGMRAVRVPEALIGYRRHESNVSSTRTQKERDRLLALIRKNHPHPESLR